jgi:hypothetical protein
MTDSTIRLTYRGKVGPDAEVFIEATDLVGFQQALSALGLATLNAPQPEAIQNVVPTATPVAEKKAKAAKPVKAEDPIPVKVEAPAPAVETAQPDAPAARTPAEAAAAIRAYGSKTSIDAAKKLLGHLGLARTADITPDMVETVFEAIARAEADL